VLKKKNTASTTFFVHLQTILHGNSTETNLPIGILLVYIWLYKYCDICQDVVYVNNDWNRPYYLRITAWNKILIWKNLKVQSSGRSREPQQKKRSVSRSVARRGQSVFLSKRFNQNEIPVNTPPLHHAATLKWRKYVVFWLHRLKWKHRALIS